MQVGSGEMRVERASSEYIMWLKPLRLLVRRGGWTPAATAKRRETTAGALC